MSRTPDGEREDRLLQLHALLKAEPRTMKQLVNWLKVDRRTVYRYMDDLEKLKKIRIKRLGTGRPTRFYLQSVGRHTL